MSSSATSTCGYTDQSGNPIHITPKRPSMESTMSVWYSECRYVKGLGLVLGRFPDGQCCYIPENCYYKAGSDDEQPEMNAAPALLQRFCSQLEKNGDGKIQPKSGSMGSRILSIYNGILTGKFLDDINPKDPSPVDPIDLPDDDYSVWQHILSCFDKMPMVYYPCSPAKIPIACATDLESRASGIDLCSQYPYDYMLFCAHLPSPEDIQFACKSGNPYIFRGWVKFINLNTNDSVLLPLFSLDADIVRQIAMPSQAPCGDIEALIKCIREGN